MDKALFRKFAEQQRKKNKGPMDVSPEDLALWRKVTSGVQPLKKQSMRLQDAGIIGETNYTDQPQVSQRTGASQLPRATPVELPVSRKLPELSHGKAPGLDKSTAKKLRRGKVPIEGSIDLHGMTTAQAHPALDRFLASSMASGKRCVSVVTGKGYRGEGILRAEVPRWLNQSPNRERVLSFSYGTPNQGGTGALIVMLKRMR